jgi:hypothetical protein
MSCFGYRAGRAASRQTQHAATTVPIWGDGVQSLVHFYKKPTATIGIGLHDIKHRESFSGNALKA